MQYDNNRPLILLQGFYITLSSVMSGEPPAKRLKVSDKKSKKNHFRKQSRKARIEIGDRGILVKWDFLRNRNPMIQMFFRISSNM